MPQCEIQYYRGRSILCLKTCIGGVQVVISQHLCCFGNPVHCAIYDKIFYIHFNIMQPQESYPKQVVKYGNYYVFMLCSAIFLKQKHKTLFLCMPQCATQYYRGRSILCLKTCIGGVQVVISQLLCCFEIPVHCAIYGKIFYIHFLILCMQFYILICKLLVFLKFVY